MTVSPVVIGLLVVAGVVAGAIGAMVGIGGGILLIPVLVLWFHVPAHQAVASSLVAVVATSAAASS
ncbi:MAG: TSUP family transporter, partial [Actinomycetota bacterium]